MAAVLKENTDVLPLNQSSLKIPQVGLGTWRSEKGQAYEATLAALKSGYKHIDTASAYGNEEEVGKAIKDSGVAREDIFVTTKLFNEDHKKVAQTIDSSLKKLGLEYVDLFLIHWPVSTNPDTGKDYEDWDYVDTYKQFQKVLESGRTKAIGVSNFTIKKLERLLSDPEVTVVPAVNQVETHPFLPQFELIDYLHKQGIILEAYSPFGSEGSPLLDVEEVKTIASKNSANPGQVLVSWAVQRQTVVLPKSVHEKRVVGNRKTFKLPDDEFETINNLHKKYGIKRLNDPFPGVFSDAP